MKVVIITQNEPFYLAKNIKWLLNNMPAGSEVVGVVLLKASPFGRRMSFMEKIIETVGVFGVNFFFRYSVRFLIAKLFSNDVRSFLRSRGVPIISLVSNINSTASLDMIREKAPDLLISIAGNEIFKKDLIEMAPRGCLNLHSSLLPKYRGLMPSFWVLRNKETESGYQYFSSMKELILGLL